jgi:holo-[acyl-carrier protein] synthase
MDLVSVAEVADSVSTTGQRYLDRVYTAHEQACCPGRPEVAAAGLAARFAAKEAVVKVLRPVGPRPPWRSIEVRRSAGGACELSLSGAAQRLASEAGISELAVSLTHEGPWAAAVVVAVYHQPHDGAPGTNCNQPMKETSNG